MVDRRIDSVTIAYICGKNAGLAAQRLDLAFHAVQLVRLEIDQSNISTVFRQTEGDAATDTLCSAGNKDDFSAE
ncbi:hypothetical protein AA105894_0414 [Asaia spathodeae NBRC 105894]|nr:hypothetical protein AA105894_0414 [Asaia spathodeae NBRC 105894]